MKLQFQKNLQERKEAVDQFMNNYLAEIRLQNFAGLVELKKSFSYSLVRGGKRFRPVLSLLLAEEFGVSPKRILPFASAVEMIHTYSLIHDDLPCMDNDDFRRGKPTNHKVFGESLALLAGDALLTEAFTVLAKHYGAADNLPQLIRELTQISGLQGMIGGQFLDMEAQGFDLQSITQMHNLKTGALISGCFSGPGILKDLTSDQQRQF